MGVRNYLIEGVSGTGKTTVGEELQRRGYHVVHGDRELKYPGDPETGEPVVEPVHDSVAAETAWHHAHLCWPVDRVRSIVADHRTPITFFCGGSRNFPAFISLFDRVFVLAVDDLQTVLQRLDERVARDPTDFGGKPEDKALVARLHATQEDVPAVGTRIDATAPLGGVVDQILEACGL